MARLILINGPPGIGKSTIASRYARVHPLTLRLDVDQIRDLISGWEQAPERAGQAARALVVGMAGSYLALGLDVVVAQLYGRGDDLDRLEGVAEQVGADFVEVVLTDERERAARRFAARGGPKYEAVEHTWKEDGPMTGFYRLYDRVQSLLPTRTGAVIVQSVDGDIDGTYDTFVRVVDPAAVISDDELVVISDPRVVAVPVVDNGEPLVDLRGFGVACRPDSHKATDNDDWAHVRQGVAERLDAAQRMLPPATRFLVAEGYRPLSLQTRYYDEHLSGLRAKYPDWDDDRLARTAALHVAPPEAAAHCTGGAIDLTLCDADGDELDMGTALNATPAASGNRCFTRHPAVTGAARANRTLFAHALFSQGFVNYPPEWWHWSYGDRYWAFSTGVGVASYGPAHR